MKDKPCNSSHHIRSHPHPFKAGIWQQHTIAFHQSHPLLALCCHWYDGLYHFKDSAGVLRPQTFRSSVLPDFPTIDTLFGTTISVSSMWYNPAARFSHEHLVYHHTCRTPAGKWWMHIFCKKRFRRSSLPDISMCTLRSSTLMFALVQTSDLLFCESYRWVQENDDQSTTYSRT